MKRLAAIAILLASQVAGAAGDLVFSGLWPSEIRNEHGTMVVSFSSTPAPAVACDMKLVEVSYSPIMLVLRAECPVTASDITVLRNDAQVHAVASPPAGELYFIVDAPAGQISRFSAHANGGYVPPGRSVVFMR